MPEQTVSKLHPALSNYIDNFGRVVHCRCTAPFPDNWTCIILSSILVFGEISTLVTRSDLIALDLAFVAGYGVELLTQTCNSTTAQSRVFPFGLSPIGNQS